MKKFFSLLLFAFYLTVILVPSGCKTHLTESVSENGEDENDEYDGPEQAMQMELNKTKDLSLGYVPTERLLTALDATLQNRVANRNTSVTALNWIERGPNSDVTGPSNGNTRSNSGVSSGRIRAVMVDSSDASHKTVWVAGVDGGLWKTNNITVSPANWTVINDYFANLAITSITQDPSNYNVMYFCTGEPFSNIDAVRGVGVFKSTDGGNTWNLLPSSSPYVFSSKIMCDFQGNVYLATRGFGLVRSTNGGSSWTDITPSGLNTRISDIEISTNNNRLHVSSGLFTASLYRYTDNAATVTASGWTSPVTPYPSYNSRCEIAAMGNTLYALPSSSSVASPNNYDVATIYKSTDGGTNWAPTTGQPASGWASGQAWYALSCGINPANPDEVIVGGLDNHISRDGGATWTKISTWVGTGGQYVHADQHNIQWYDEGNKLIFSCDGGIHYSADQGVSIRDRNVGLRIKQFYSIAMHPTSLNYFLAGAQDNGTHQFTSPGLAATVEVTGGDGGYVDIDQDEPQYQFGATVYNQYRRSINGGASWSSVNFSGVAGQFINPYDYDDVGNKLYAGHSAGQYLRWNDPQTGNSSSLIPIPSFNGSEAVAVTVSPYTANRVYFGTKGGRIVKVDDANGDAPVDVNLTGAGMVGYLNNIAVGNSDQTLVACYSNYGVNNVWFSSNGGTSWTAIDGNLPDMPVRWAVFNPDNNTKLYIATETGVWQTDLINGSSTVWENNNTFPTVRTDMLRYRPSDRTIAAGTHGRGVWTATVPTVAGCNPPVITTQPNNVSICSGNTATFTVAATGDDPLFYKWQVSTDGGATYTDIAGATNATYTFTATAGQNGNRYRAIVSNNCAPSATSTAVILSVPVTTLTTQPASQTVCAGANATFTVVATGTSLTYQWQVSTDNGTTFTNITGANASSYTITSATVSQNGNQFRVIVGSMCLPSVTSGAATLTVSATASITAQPLPQTVCSPANASFSVTAAGGSLAYQWQVSTDGGTNFTNISGATSATYSFPTTPSQSGNLYRVIITSCGSPVTSNSVLLTVNAPVAITGQPADQSVCLGMSTSFTVTATGTGLSYQWQISTDGGSSYADLSNGPLYSGVTTTTLTITNATVSLNNNRYRLKVSGTCPSAVTTNGAVLTVNSPASLNTSPADVTVCTDGNATFTVTATNASSYQWQVSTNNGTSYSNIAGATASSYTITGVTDAQNGNLFRAVVIGAGNCGTVTSASARLIVSPRPVVNLTASPYTKLLPGLVTTLTVTSSLTSPSINYVWFKNNIVLPGVTGSTYLVDITRLGDYKVKVTDATSGCNNTTSTISISDSVSSNLFIYPNPNNGIFTIAYFSDGLNGKQYVNIYDSKGSKVTVKEVTVSPGYNLIPINMRRNSGGIYIVELRDDTGKRLKSGEVLIR